MSEAAREVAGGCFCGAIRYRILGRPSAGICYCGNCRKAVGAQSVVWVDSHRNAVDVLQGEPARHKASNEAVWSFCAHCGSTLFWEPADGSGMMAVTAGTLDDPAAFPPERTSSEEERLPWEPSFDKYGS